MDLDFDDLMLPGRTPTEASHPANKEFQKRILDTSSIVESEDDDEEISEITDQHQYNESQMQSSPIKNTEMVDQERYEQLRRSAFSKNTLKKVIHSLTSAGVGPVLLFVIGGFTKVYVGELTAEALQVQKEKGLTGPITPEVLAEAHRRYHCRNFRSTLCTFFPRNISNKRFLCKRL